MMRPKPSVHPSRRRPCTRGSLHEVPTAGIAWVNKDHPGIAANIEVWRRLCAGDFVDVERFKPLIAHTVEVNESALAQIGNISGWREHPGFFHFGGGGLDGGF